MEKMNPQGGKKKIPRPMNAFMLFANDHRAEFRRSHPGETNSKISVRLGAAWKELNGKDKTQYYQLSKKAEIEHRNKYPGYTYCPNEARSSKRARRERRSNSSRKNEKEGVTTSSSSPPQSSSSNESCLDVHKSQHALNESADAKSEQRQGLIYPGQYRGDIWHCGQGDQIPPYPMPYGPQYLPPMGYPRFPCWDFRPHPYMAAQYGRMPFMPHPMMYQCPLPPQQMGFGLPMVQPDSEQKAMMGSSVSSLYPPVEGFPSNTKTGETTQIQDNVSLSNPMIAEPGNQRKESEPLDTVKKSEPSSSQPSIQQPELSASGPAQPHPYYSAATNTSVPTPVTQMNSNKAVGNKSEPSLSQQCTKNQGLPASGWAHQIPHYSMPSTNDTVFVKRSETQTKESQPVTILKNSELPLNQPCAQTQEFRVSGPAHEQPTYNIPITNIRITDTKLENTRESQPLGVMKSEPFSIHPQNPSSRPVPQQPYQVDIQFCSPPYSVESAHQETGPYSFGVIPQHPSSYTYTPSNEQVQYLPSTVKSANVTQPKTYADLSSAEVKIVTIPTN